MLTSVGTDILPASHEPVRPRRASSAPRGLRITFAGLLCLVVVLLVGVAALKSEANLLFLLFSISLGVMSFNAGAAVLAVRQIDVERSMPGSVVAGRLFKITYLVHSRRRWGKSWALVVIESLPPQVRHEFPQGFIPVLSAGEEQRIELVARCSHRGRVALSQMVVASGFPFGLFVCEVRIPAPAELVVYPAVAGLRRNPWRHWRSGQAGSGKRAHRPTPDEDFYGVREYRQGDSFRTIHWKRSAHAGQLVVRESAPFRASQFVVIVDAWPGGALPERQLLSRSGRWGGLNFWPSQQSKPPADDVGVSLLAERVISAAASAACDGLERGHRVGLIARAEVPIVIAPAGGRPHRQRLLHEFALLNPVGKKEPLDQFVARIRWTFGWQARCILFSPEVREAHRRTSRFLATRAESVILATPGTAWFETVFATDFAHRGRQEPR